MKTMSSHLAFVYHPDTLLHDTGAGHPERRQRLETVVSHLMGTDLWGAMEHLRPEEAPREALLRVHPESHLAAIEENIRRGQTMLDDGDTVVCEASWRAAKLAAGGVLLAVDRACGPDHQNAFCAVRPPGHHAETARVMGFCLMNSIAAGARYAQRQWGAERVAILDWDVHHGNGTQEIFWRDESVLYVSTHQYPLWPGTGAANETGDGRGAGATLNCPLAPGGGEKEYLEAFRERILPALSTYRPDLLMISAGFDAHRLDPLANMNLEETSFALFTRMLCDVLAPSTKCGIVSVLEGGYDLKALAQSVEAHVREMR